MTTVANAVIIEDETLVANMLVICLALVPGLRVVGTAENGVSGMKLCLHSKPDLVLLDLEMPGQSGLDVAKELRRKLPATRIIVVSSHCEPYAVHELSRLKIDGFVDKGEPLNTLLEVIRIVLEGKTLYCPRFNEVMRELRQHAESYQKILSAREIEVLILLAEGWDDAAIGKNLGISPVTVSVHRRNIRHKLDAHNDRDLMNYARQCGMVSLEIAED
jgi:DNA-binding NarL/FixJ family response regulator